MYRDHHRFHCQEVAAASAAAHEAGALLLTTEKDDARLGGFDLSRHVLRVDLSFVDAPPVPGELLL